MKLTQVVVTLMMLSAFASFNAGCIQPPPDKDALGDEVSVDQKNAALTQALADMDQDKAFHVNDNGVILVVDNVMTNSMIRETHQDQVTKIDDQYITYTDYVVETKEFGTGKIKRTGAAAGPTATPSPTQPSTTPTPAAGTPQIEASANVFLILPRSFENFVQFVKHTVTGIFSRISVQPSTANAENRNGLDALPDSSKSPVSAKDQSLSVGLDSLVSRVLKSHGLEVLDDPSLASSVDSGLLTGSPTPAPNASPSPAPAQASTSRYFGLQVTQEKYLTKNCAQLSDCKVPATRIEYAELKTGADGSQRKFRWYYEISTQVPGLFTLMEQCLSTVIIQNGTQYPFRECIHVNDFRWGQAQN